MIVLSYMFSPDTKLDEIVVDDEGNVSISVPPTSNASSGEGLGSEGDSIDEDGI